jgi:hypothetical protein
MNAIFTCLYQMIIFFKNALNLYLDNSILIGNKYYDIRAGMRDSISNVLLFYNGLEVLKNIGCKRINASLFSDSYLSNRVTF